MKLNLKILNIFFSLILLLYPLTFAATSVYALPSLPGTPSIPSTPDSPEDPDTPTLPGEEEAVGTTSTPESSGTNTDGDSDTSSDTEVSSSNTDTGADSTNTADTTVDNNAEVDINNNADVDNLLNVDADSGGNDADKNSGDGSVVSGDATIDGALETDANSINIGALECSTQCNTISIGSLESGNSNTGAGSANDSNSTLNNDSSLNIDNNADFNNLVMFDADSGDNSASYNTGNGTVEAGDAEIILTAINAANNVNVDYEVFNVYDDQTGDIIVDFDSIGGSPYVVGGLGSSNDSTGADSDNNATTNANNTTQILIDNNGNIVNNYYLDANTGDNSADKNTGDGSVTTGDANVVFNLINFLNNTFLGGNGELLLGVVNIFGNYGGNIVLDGLDSAGAPNNWGGYLGSSNDTTGAGSNNDANTSVDSDTDISLNNSADILNNLTLDANTGENDAGKNTGSGSISTGDTNASVDVTNVGNNTVIGDGGTIWMVLVNNLGTWTGQLFDTDSAGGAYSPFFTFSLAPDGSLTASNQDTGADSNNEATTSVENDTDIAITNTATITNNVMIDANTGGNSASYNTGSGDITTGDANISANIVNMFNNIFLSGRFALTIVNIFGTFTGDILQGSEAIGSVIVDPTESIAITPAQTSSSPNSPIFYGGSNLDLGSANLDKNEKSASSALVLAASQSDPAPTSVFNADRGLFDDFKLSFLIFPVVFGIIFSLGKRVLFKEVKK